MGFYPTAGTNPATVQWLVLPGFPSTLELVWPDDYPVPGWTLQVPEAGLTVGGAVVGQVMGFRLDTGQVEGLPGRDWVLVDEDGDPRVGGRFERWVGRGAPPTGILAVNVDGSGSVGIGVEVVPPATDPAFLVPPAGGLVDGSMVAASSDAWVTRTPVQVLAAIDAVPTSRTVAGQALTGDVTLADMGLGNVDDTADADKPISTATATALGDKATDADVVKLAGSQTITGLKTFTSPQPLAPYTDPLAPTGSSTPAAVIGGLDIRGGGSNNTGIGAWSGTKITTATNTTTLGSFSGRGITTGSHNTIVGAYAGQTLATGSSNMFLGTSAGSPSGKSTVTGSQNIAIGFSAGASDGTDPSRFVAIGFAASAADNAVAVGYNTKASHTNSVALGASTTTTAAYQVMIGPRDLEITSAAKGVVLRSPDGTRYRIAVANGGALSATAVI